MKLSVRSLLFTYEERSRRSSESDAFTSAGNISEHSDESWRPGKSAHSLVVNLSMHIKVKVMETL